MDDIIRRVTEAEQAALKKIAAAAAESEAQARAFAEELEQAKAARKAETLKVCKERLEAAVRTAHEAEERAIQTLREEKDRILKDNELRQNIREAIIQIITEQ